MKFFPRLHWLRGFLALTVVLSHVAHLTSTPPNQALVRCGTSAVTVFFVLSGFVMFQVVGNSGVGIAPALAFLIKRILRIFPAYWLFLALTALFDYCGGRTWDGAGGAGQDWMGGLLLLSFHSARGLPMPIAWSLIFEMIFYYMLAALVWNRTAGAVVVGAYFAWSLLEHWMPVKIYGLYPIAGLFLAGLILGAMNQKVPKLLPKLVPLLFVGLLLFLLHIVYGFSFYTLVERGAAVLLVAGVLGLEHAYRPRLDYMVQAVLQFLGTVSFSLYLGHTLVQSILFPYLGHPTAWTVIGYVAVPVAVAYASFCLVEKPGMDFAKWIDSRFILRGPVAEVHRTRELVVPEEKPAARG